MVAVGINMECNAYTFNIKPGKQQFIYLFPVLRRAKLNRREQEIKRDFAEMKLFTLRELMFLFSVG